MMNAFFFRTSSLNADVRSTRSHSASLSTHPPFSRFPYRIRHYIAREQYGQADTNSFCRPERARNRGRFRLRSPALRGLMLRAPLRASSPRFCGVSRPVAGLLGTTGRPDDKGDDRAAEHDRRDDVEGEGVALGGVEYVGDQERSEHAAEAPGGQHQAVDLPDVRGTEVVGGEGRHRPETAAVAGDYDERQDGEQEVHADQRQQEEEHGLQEEHREEDPLPAYRVRQPGPPESSEGVGHRDDADQAGGNCRVDAGDLLRHRRGLHDDRDAGGDVQEQQRPERVPLPGPHSAAEIVIHPRAVAALARIGLPAFRSPAFGGMPHEQRRTHDHDKVDDAEDSEGAEHPDRGDERLGYERRNEGATAEARHGDAGDEAALVWKPFDQGGNRHYVA